MRLPTIFFILLFSLFSLCSISSSYIVKSSICLSPLEGGPQFLPLHSRTFVRDGDAKVYVVDFLPLNPTSSSTTKSLLSLQAVEGEVRLKEVR